MPDLQNFVIAGQPDFNPGVPIARVKFSCQVTNSQTGAVELDLTGANAVDFVFRVQGFTQAQHKKLANFIAHKIIAMKAGFDSGDD